MAALVVIVSALAGCDHLLLDSASRAARGDLDTWIR